MTTRHDLFGPVHKGLRHMMSSTLSRMGTLDVDDHGAATPVFDQLDELIDALLHHIKLEDRFVIPALEEVAPGSTVYLREDHGIEERALKRIRERADELDVAIAEMRSYRGELSRDLYLSLADVIADTLVHMRSEEREHNALLWKHYSDEQLRHVQASQIATERPEELARGIRWLLPAMTPAERVMLVGGARLLMPPAAFDGLLPLVRSVLPGNDWTKLASALSIAA